jgi:hypothetical protein
VLLERNRDSREVKKDRSRLRANIRRQGRHGDLKAGLCPAFLLRPGFGEAFVTAYGTRSQTRDIVNPALRELLKPTTSISCCPSSDTL